MRLFVLSILLVYPLFPQSFNRIQLIPSQDGSQIGRIRFREKLANGQNYLDLIPPETILANRQVTLPDSTNNYTLVGLQIPDQTFTERVIFGRTGVGNELVRFQRASSAYFLTVYETVDSFMTVNATGPLTFDSNIEVRFARGGVPVWMFADDVGATGRLSVGTYTPGTFPFNSNEGKVQIYTSNPSVVGLTILGASLQNGDLFRVRKFDNSPIMAARGDGKVVIGACSGSLWALTICPTVALGTGLSVRESGSYYTPIQTWTDTFGNVKAQFMSTGDFMVAGQPTAPPVTPPNFGGIRFDQVTQKLQYSENGSPWADLVGSGVSLPVVDTTELVYGSFDSSKRMRFEVDGLSPFVTRVLTPQDANYILAGVNVPNTFTVNQILGTGVSLLPQTAGQGNLGTTSQRFSGAAFESGVDIRNVVGGPTVGTGYLAANKLEIHRGTSGEFWNITSPQSNYLALKNPSGLTIMSWDTSLANYYLGVHGSIFPFLSASQTLGLSSARWHGLFLNGTIDGATNMVDTNSVQNIGGNKSFIADTFLNGVTLKCSSGDGTCNIGSAGGRPNIEARSLKVVNGSGLSMFEVDTSGNIYAGAAGPATTDPIVCPAGQAITQINISKGIVISASCSTP